MLMIKSLEKLSIFNKEKMSKVVAKKAVILIPNMKKKTKTRRMKNSVCACVWNSNACVIFFSPSPLLTHYFFPLIKRNASAWCRTTLKHKKRKCFSVKDSVNQECYPSPFFCPQKRYNFLEKLDFPECENFCVHMYDIFPYSPRKCVEFLTLPSHLGYNTVQKIDAHHLFPLFWTRASCILVRKIEEHTCHYFPLWDLRIRLFLHSSPPNPQTDNNFYNCTCCCSGARKTERKLWLWKILKIGWPWCMMRGDNLRSSRCDLIFYVTKKKNTK